MRQIASLASSAALVLGISCSLAPLSTAAPAASLPSGSGAPALSVASSFGDPLVAKALGRIAKVEAAEAALAPGDKQKAATQINQLAWASKRLKAVVQQSTPEWKAAMARHDAVLKKLEAKRDAVPAPKPKPNPKPGAGGGSGSGGTPPAPAPAPATYDHQKLVQLNQSISEAFKSAQAIARRLYLDGNRVNGMRGDVRRYREKMAAYPATDANVKIVAGNVDLLEKLITDNLAQIEADRKAAPGIEARLDTIFDKYDGEKFPLGIEPPFREGQVRAFAMELQQRRTVKIPNDLAWLQSVADNVVVKRHRVSSVMNSLTGTETRKLDVSQNYVVSGINGLADQGLRMSDELLKVSPEDRQEMLLYVLGNGAMESTISGLEESLEAVKLGRFLDKELKLEGGPNRDAQAQKLSLAISHVKELCKLGLSEMRMPKSASDDVKLQKIASDLLKDKEVRKEWGIVGEPLRTVISYDKQAKERREAWVSSVSATTAEVRYYNYKWEEFGITTAEKVGDKVFLYYHRLKRYESGDNSTPIGKWFVSSRIETSEILRENVDK